MKKLFRFVPLAACAVLPYAGLAADGIKPAADPKVRMTTTLGVVELELDAGHAPVSTSNFLKYVDNGFYDGTIFHRVIPGFMIQGGGFEPGLKKKSTEAPIKNEADNGLKNRAGTIAMARTMDPNSATAQFFINAVDNAFLDHRDKSTNGWGYAVFGKVTKGMDVIKKIEAVPTARADSYENVPKQDVVIQKMERITK